MEMIPEQIEDGKKLKRNAHPLDQIDSAPYLELEGYCISI